MGYLLLAIVIFGIVVVIGIVIYRSAKKRKVTSKTSSLASKMGSVTKGNPYNISATECTDHVAAINTGRHMGIDVSMSVDAVRQGCNREPFKNQI